MTNMVSRSSTVYKALTPLRPIDTKRKLREVLSSNLEFHSESSNHSTHDVHAFPAKFPPQLPAFFLQNLTLPGEIVLDPMVGSGTTLLEALRNERNAIGLDIDPLAVLISTVKTSTISASSTLQIGQEIVARVALSLAQNREQLQVQLAAAFDEETRSFINYWFDPETQLELYALKTEIDKVAQPDVHRFLQLALSAIIITKSGGVSLAWDLAHTRPHKLKQGVPKSARPALPDFSRRLIRNAESLTDFTVVTKARVDLGNAERIALADESVDLIFTSPPYASNAIDYMRASKFALVWLGRSIAELKSLRSECIGGESTRDFAMESLLPQTTEVVTAITTKNLKRGLALRRYYSEMTRVLKESYRVLKHDRAAVFVVGSAVMSGIDSAAERCLSEIAVSVGFELIDIRVRRLDRNRRMLPVAAKKSDESQIENRMHEEYVLGFYKPPLIPLNV